MDETLRLRYRWLDLRRDKLQRNIGLRAQMVSVIRREMEGAGFLDIQTPLLFKPTPEGARDFVVPTRLQPGRFFALPQSPQILKQLTMIAGFDRYYQIAICFRDEDLRADRVQEITQLDVEMSFPDQELIFALMERTMATIWRECIGVELEAPFPRLTHAEADLRYGSDKPDVRFGPRSPTRPRARATRLSASRRGALRPLPRRAEGVLARRAGGAREVAEGGGEGVAYPVVDESGEVRSPIAKFLSERELAAFSAPPGSTVLSAPTRAQVSRALGQLRLHLGRELGLIDEDAWRWRGSPTSPCSPGTDERLERRAPPVHPSGAGVGGAVSAEPGAAVAHAYDLICNGNELGGGSFRIHEPELQAKVFDLLSLSPAEQRAKFGFLLDALAMGAPPMGGIAFGIDRMTMVLAGEPNLRDVIAFPKNQAGVDPMSGEPSDVTPEQLAELGIRLAEQEDESRRRNSR